MRSQIGLLGVVGFFGLIAVAYAQPPSASTAGTQFDGTYRLVSAARVNKTYVTRGGGRIGQCPDRRAGPLTIVQGQAKYTSATGRQLEGTVGPQGQLTMRYIAPPSGSGYRPVELTVSGSVDGAGTARARQSGSSCSYDFVWQK
jgi:hypothetical protein